MEKKSCIYEISHHLHTFSSQYKYAKWDTAILQMWDIGLKVKSLQLSADLSFSAGNRRETFRCEKVTFICQLTWIQWNTRALMMGCIKDASKRDLQKALREEQTQVTASPPHLLWIHDASRMRNTKNQAHIMSFKRRELSMHFHNTFMLLFWMKYYLNIRCCVCNRCDSTVQQLTNIWSQTLQNTHTHIHENSLHMHNKHTSAVCVSVCVCFCDALLFIWQEVTGFCSKISVGVCVTGISIALMLIWCESSEIHVGYYEIVYK